LLGGGAHGLLARDALVIAEHRRKRPLQERYGTLERTRVLEQGDAALSFYAANEKHSEGE
jgi:16S rRNA (guanine966-N2)-methyltransferase